ncbi:MAG: pirin family protein [Flavobacteriaceae bacterium]
MTKYRTIRRIVPAQRVNMGGHLLDQPLPMQGLDQIDPFLLIHHWDHPLKGGKRQNEVGVGPHPHRGFSPVTFVFKGSVQHRDSLGNNATVAAGGTQWMHAGRGITHSERPSRELAENGGDNEFIQFWVNTPAKYKMEVPHYLPLTDAETPKIERDGARIAVVAGTFDGVTGPAKTYSPQTLLRAEAIAGSEFQLALPQDFNTLIYVLDGTLGIDGKTIADKDMAWFHNDAGTILVKAERDTRFIVLSGEPIDEEVSTYGPFVMNTQTELLEALRDAQMGKMGVLIEEFER